MELGTKYVLRDIMEQLQGATYCDRCTQQSIAERAAKYTSHGIYMLLYIYLLLSSHEATHQTSHISLGQLITVNAKSVVSSPDLLSISAIKSFSLISTCTAPFILLVITCVMTFLHADQYDASVH